ncbi:MAG: DUF1549 domain-containing protein [Pedosphaera sp.]|nr:DUF1549 domain-containing protein [Pedosphaera sp.]
MHLRANFDPTPSREFSAQVLPAPAPVGIGRGLVALLVGAWLVGGMSRTEVAAGESPPNSRQPPVAHWSFQPLRSAKPPPVKNVRWSKTALDPFILAKLEQSGIEPAPEADKRTLIRRATFDLIGLPPTPEEVTTFLSDTAPDAFPRVVDRLLESPHYGERWGRYWLDVARYADNKGYVFFEEKSYPWAWVYRDYVVRSFNEDKPFHRFVLEQLAADQLDLGGDSRTLAAMGFLTVGDHFSNNIHDILDDRIDVVSRGLLGLTVGCARCHDHKFDPVTTADYYALYGVFRSSSEPLVPPMIGEPGLSETYEGFDLELIQRQRTLRDFVENKHREIVQTSRTRIADSLMAVYAQRNQPATESFMLITDPGDINPVVISRWRTLLEQAGATNGIWAPWNAFAELNETNFTALSPAANTSLLKANGLNSRVRSAFSNAPPASMKDVAERYASVLRAVDKQSRESLPPAGLNSGPAVQHLPDADDDDLLRVLYGPEAPPDVPAQMDWGFLSLLPDRASQGEFQKLLKALEQWLMHGPEAPARAMVLRDLPVAYEPRIFQRGNPSRLGASVPRRFLQLIEPTGRPFSRGSGRLELAQAIVDPKNPLTARVLVNRVWLHHFGAGLVTTPSDLGRRSDPPSHPELLDWLADEFIRSGWRVKHLHRLIMNSAVYQQACQSPVAQNRSPMEQKAATLNNQHPSSNTNRSRPAAMDPENRLLSHMSRRRHDFETQRDAILTVAGQLDPTPGGSPVEYATPRRTLYTFVNRMDVPPVRTTFDFPSPSASCPQRLETTVAPQALYLMNNEFVADCAAAVLRRPDVAGLQSTAAKIDRLHSLLFSRPPAKLEQGSAERFLGDSPSEKAWQQYAHALMMANEFSFVD